MTIAFPAGEDRLPSGRHRATVDEIEAVFVDAFPASRRRRPLFENWRNLHAAIRRIIPIQEHWMNGSFVTTKLEPGDIDVVTLLDGDAFDQLGSVDLTLLKGLLTHKVTEALHGCDSCVVLAYPEGDPDRARYDAARAYWEGWFGEDRGGNPKGYVEVVTP